MDIWSKENEQVPVSLYFGLSDHKSRPPLMSHWLVATPRQSTSNFIFLKLCKGQWGVYSASAASASTQHDSNTNDI